MRFITVWMIVFSLLVPTRTMAADPAFVQLVCSVDGAEVRLDGKLFGVTPVQPIQVRAGRHVITITRQGYMNFTKSIQIEAGVTLPVFVDLLQEDFGLPELELEPLNQAPLPAPKQQPPKTSDMPLPELDLMPLGEEMSLPKVEEKIPEAPVVEVPGLILTEPVPPVAAVSHGRPWYKSWWFIGGSTGAAVLAGVVAGVVVGTKDNGKGSPPVVIWAP